MKLQITHRTRYAYAQPVMESFNEVRLQPTSADGQVCHSFILKVLPTARLSHYHDFNLNYVHFFELPEPHDTLLVESNSIVTTSALQVGPADVGFPMSRLAECAQMERCYEFLLGSHYVSLGPDVWRLAMDATVGETEAWSAVNAIMRFIHKNFVYLPDSTTVNTPMSEAIAQRRGVCQDFAHVMIGMCRSLKIPARYVSGYLYNGPEDQLQGAQASHAWVEVFLPEIGWRALDPTNNQLADERHVRVAVGRDYADVAPIKGNYKGTPQKTMIVEVSVTALN